MHSYHIIHYDIKPENICFSKEYNKAVFIDFGFSEIIKELCGLKTYTNFRGSPNFCGH
jgi:serine/threonine protein kinase